MILQMECGIDEWGTGIKTKVPFTTMDYHPMFDAHLKCLCKLRKASKKHELLDKICLKLYNVGWYIFMFLCSVDNIMFWSSFHSGTQPITPAISSAVSASAFIAAVWEYKDNTDTETDGEDGK